MFHSTIMVHMDKVAAYVRIGNTFDDRSIAVTVGNVTLFVNRENADAIATAFRNAADILAGDPWADDAPDMMAAFIGECPPFPSIRD